MNMAYASQAGLGLPERAYYFEPTRRSATPTWRTSPRCWSCPACPPPMRPSRPKDVVAFETRLAKASKSSEELSRDV